MTPLPDAPPTEPATTSFGVPVAPSAEATPPNTAAIVSFVFGLLFFIPFVTQVIALVVGCYALTTRKERQRVALAWAGITLAGLALLIWTGIFRFATTSVRTTFTISGAPYTSSEEPEDWQRAETLSATVERIQRAAIAYHRDFGAWPQSLEALAGHGLPPGFGVPDGITYRAVPADGDTRRDWALVVSGEISVDRHGNRLPKPHRLVARLDGGIDLLPVDAVAELLAAQPVP